MKWGLLGPDADDLTKHRRTLGLSRVAQNFNEKAVPGLGGVWFGKQLFLSLLGVYIGNKVNSDSRMKKQNIKIANAIEALACKIAFKHMGKSENYYRLPGSNKLNGKDFSVFKSFSKVSKTGFYVSQPMRMRTTQVLPALGLVETNSPRFFNTFKCSECGKTFIEKSIKNNKTVIDILMKWVKKTDLTKKEISFLTQYLSPLEPLPDNALNLLTEILNQGLMDKDEYRNRRPNALKWVELLRNGSISAEKLWSQHAPQFLSAEHWRDLQAGAVFFEMRDKALQILDSVGELLHRSEKEMNLKEMSLAEIVPKIQNEIDALKNKAKDYEPFITLDNEADIFYKECLRNNESVLRSLIERDGQILEMKGNDTVGAGIFFQESMENKGKNWDTEEEKTIPQGKEMFFPPYISDYIWNLYRLNLDLNGELQNFLKNSSDKNEKNDE